MSLSKEDEAAKTMEFLKRNQQETEKTENYQIHKVFPRKIYLREKGELTMQLVGIASGGQPYESSHNCFNGVKPTTHDYRNNSDDEVIVEEYDTMPNNSPRMSSYRSSRLQKKNTTGGGGSMIWRRPPTNESY